MKKDLVGSILKLNCPRCRKTKLFNKRGWFVYRGTLEMPDNCSNCEQKFEIEPGFWLGALWPSYPLVLLVEVPFLFMALFNVFGTPWIAFGLMLIAFVVFWPVFVRLGRSIWIHLWVKYRA